MPYKDPEQRKAHSRAYYQANKEEILKYQAIYQKRHKEERKTKDARYRKTDKCKATQKRYNDSVKGKQTNNKNARIYYKRHVKEISERKSCKDFSPIQNGELNLTKGESSSYVTHRITAVPQAHKSIFGERTSKRKGVAYDKFRQKWCAYLKHSGIYNREFFETEEEAIAYRIYLEDKYYTVEQLAIRDKYEKLNTKKE